MSNTEACPASQSIQNAANLIRILQDMGINMDPRAYEIRKMKPEELKFRLDVEGIPYKEMKVKKMILIPKECLQRCRQIEDHEATKGNYLQEFSHLELETVIAGHPAVSDKSVVTIKNMTAEEMALFLRKCNTIKPGLLLETERHADRYFNVSLPAGLLSKHDKEKLLDAYAQAQIGITGVNTNAKISGNFIPSADNYVKSVFEHRFIRDINRMILSKLNAAGHDLQQDFGEYFKTFKREMAKAIDQLCKKETPKGFHEGLLARTMRSFSSLQEDTYSYAAAVLNSQHITVKQAVQKTIGIDIEPLEDKEKGKEVE